MSVQVPKGYKQTEVGVIPEDWMSPTLGEITKLMTNGFVGTAKKHYVENENGVLYIQGYNVEENSINFHGIKYVSHQFHQEHMRSCLKEFDLLTVQTGDVGLTTFVPKKLEGANCHALIISRFDLNKAYPIFISYYINSDPGRARLRLIETGTTMKHLNVGDVLNFTVPLPSKKEQQAIAEALSDADALIESLEQLIAKKRQIKQGAMQELLTGQRRLPGFSGEWVRKQLPEIAWFQEGPGVRVWQFTRSGIKLLNGTNIFNGSLYLETTSRFISENEAYGIYSHFLADADDIVIASSGISIDRFHEKVAVVKEQNLPFCMNTSTIRFKANEKLIKKDYLFHLLRGDELKNYLGGQATGSAQLNFGPSHLNKFEVLLPDLDEQHEIAEFLSNLDSEIEALDMQLAKARQIKQAMTQELLTGHIRLI